MSGMEVKGAKILFYIGGLAVTETVISLLAVTLLLSVCGILLGRNLSKRPGKMQVLTEKAWGC